MKVLVTKTLIICISGIASLLGISCIAGEDRVDLKSNGKPQPQFRNLLWDGAASKGTDAFKQVQFQDNGGKYNSTNGSFIKAVDDATEGTVWQFHKNALDKRCEALGAKGITPALGQTYFIGFRFKLPETPKSGQPGGSFTLMQWKTSGTPNTQNYPFLLVYNSGRIKLEFYPDLTSPNILLFAEKVSPNQWYSIVIKVTAGNTTNTGNMQVWWGDDASPETLQTGGDNYAGKTFDGTSIDPKWGYYRDSGKDGDVFISRLKIGNTWNDVKPY
ncbi:heparin lyase I family protein [Pedobacter rhizosphaerae]|uniref:Polysaccharide lyase n=1 Tax=Pedobacter rhizosphaerae TaxID=390241 RepID=A0A1H9U7B2_9SPHI|nr:heparin lyase I family protein [Pedobacter rhizosphaerae]SES05037.1 Polysaccharide lyase [Pedobacter rhizosphaerae]